MGRSGFCAIIGDRELLNTICGNSLDGPVVRQRWRLYTMRSCEGSVSYIVSHLAKSV